jgi:uncharacterized membrane protein
MNVFSEAEKKRITNAIHAAELNTSGEIKLHVEERCPLDNPLDRAVEVFHFLSLDHTALRNGVLFYLSFRDRQFAILGDSGINEKAGASFWDKEKALLYEYLHTGNTVEGLCLAIEMAGSSLKEHFPYQSDDINEISNDISFGKTK